MLSHRLDWLRQALSLPGAQIRQCCMRQISAQACDGTALRAIRHCRHLHCRSHAGWYSKEPPRATHSGAQELPRKGL